MNVSHVIIPAAGRGTRFLPFTKSVPKEMLPLLNKPAIQVVVSEGVASGIKNFYMIVNEDKEALHHYFTADLVFQHHLLGDLESLISQAHIGYITQPEPLGLGHAVLMGKEAIGNNYFGVMLPDDIFANTFPAQPALGQLMAVAQKYGASVIAVQEVAADQVSSYGIVSIKEELEPGEVELSALVEKPPVDKAPSRLAAIGRYVLSPTVFSALEKTKPGAAGEIQLTDALNYMVMNGERILAYTVKGVRHDIGTPLGWLLANISYGLENPVYAAAIKKVLGA